MIVNELIPEPQAMRDAFCDKLIALAENDPDLVVLDADLMGAMGTKPFLKRFPNRAIDCGIQEANMVSVAAGLSLTGKVPFVHTFAPFMSRRATDQVFISGAYQGANVKLIGSDPGITAQTNGGTHMPFEDMGIMRSIPTMTVIEPTDATMLNSVMDWMAGTYGMQYMRLVRKSCTKVYETGTQFTVGKASTLVSEPGAEVTIIASGWCVVESLKAVELLHHEGIVVRVLDMFTWKPLDERAVIDAAYDTGAIVTAENHSITTGLAAAVSEVVVRHEPVPVEFVGVHDRFGQVGKADYLAEQYGLAAADIVAAAKRAVARKPA